MEDVEEGLRKAPAASSVPLDAWSSIFVISNTRLSPASDSFLLPYESLAGTILAILVFFCPKSSSWYFAV